MKPRNLQLDRLEPGRKIAILRRRAGKWVPVNVYVIIDWEEAHKRWRYTYESAAMQGGVYRVAGCIKGNGEEGGRDFLSQEKTDFWYSANPKHVQQAEKSLALARETAAREAKERSVLEARRVGAFKAELRELLDKYGACLSAVVTSGDDHGVECAVRVTIDHTDWEI